MQMLGVTQDSWFISTQAQPLQQHIVFLQCTFDQHAHVEVLRRRGRDRALGAVKCLSTNVFRDTFAQSKDLMFTLTAFARGDIFVWKGATNPNHVCLAHLAIVLALYPKTNASRALRVGSQYSIKYGLLLVRHLISTIADCI